MDQPALRQLGHDLRGILAPAMMVAERLQKHADPAVQRAGDIVLDSLDKAVLAIKAAIDG
jgi:hypothetical protein